MKKLLGWYIGLKNSKGAAAVEYALIIALVVLAVVVALGALGVAISAKIDEVTAAVNAVNV